MTKVEREFVGLPSTNLPRAGAGGHPCQGVYYKAAGTTPRIAVIATHYNIDFSEHYMSHFLAEASWGGTPVSGARSSTSSWMPH